MYTANYSYWTFLFCLTKEAVYNLTFTWLVNGQALLNQTGAPKLCFPLFKKNLIPKWFKTWLLVLDFYVNV